MSRLTLAEKEHWKSRIENRINRAIESLQAKDNSLMPKIKVQAELEAHKSLGTEKLNAKLQSIKQQRKNLADDEDKLESAIYRAALGESGTANQSSYQIQSDFWTMLRQSQTRFEEELLKDSAIGNEILKLRAEKDALLDTVWLATSSAQIRDLWSRVSEVLGDPATPLQQQILADGIPSTLTE